MPTFSGPMFAPARNEYARSIFNKDGGHYNLSAFHDPDAALAMLRNWFPTGDADDLNFVLFSTSGVHGSYMTLEEVEEQLDEPDAITDVTVLVVCPRLVAMHYGNCRVTRDALPFLKQLRASSWAAMQNIGAHKPEEAG
jgi:hypothetical protein